MRWIGILITIAALGFGVLRLVHWYETHQQNKRTEALNDRISVINAMTEVSNTAVSYATDCQNFIVKWYEASLAGDSGKASAMDLFTKSCGENARSTYKDLENEAKKQRSRGGPDTPEKQAFLDAVLAYGAGYKDKGRDYDDIYAMMKTAIDRGESVGPLANSINEKLDNGLDEIDADFAELEAARSAYRNDFD